MTFKEILVEVIDWLQHDKRLTYRALKRQFDLDDDYLEDLKDAILFAHPVVDEAGRGLVWTGDPTAPELHVERAEEAERQFYRRVLTVIGLLQRTQRA